MKYINLQSKLLLLSLFIGLIVFLNACNRDEEVTPKTLEEYKAELSSLVTSEKTKVQNCIVGYNKGDFKNESLFADAKFNYLSALTAAETTLTKPDITITDIVAANKAIATPGKAFNDNLFISDRRPIHDLIVFCDTLRVHTLEGTLTGQAPAAARTTFIAAITKAKTVRSASTTIERQVLEAVEILKQALTVFQTSIIK